jgi:hypothetical protein
LSEQDELLVVEALLQGKGLFSTGVNDLHLLDECGLQLITNKKNYGGW